MDDLSREVVNQSSGVLTEAYKDLVSPTAKPVGEIIGLLPRTIKLALGRWEKWIINGEESIKLTAEILKEKLKDIPEEKITEPEPYVAIPAIQQLSYCQDNESLRELYANLLASSMNTDKKPFVHPSFVDIIKQLTPDEAKLINFIPPFLTNHIPLIDININFNIKTTNNYFKIISNFGISGIDLLESPQMIGSYIDNLDRLKLINIDYNAVISDQSKYQEMIDHPLVKNSIPNLNDDDINITYKKFSFNLTNFGVSFINTCCK